MQRKFASVGITWRALIIGAVLIPLNNYWIMQVEGVWNTGHSTCLSLMWHVVLNLLLLISINIFLLKKYLPKYALTEAELIALYAMLTLGASISGRDMLQILIPVMGWAFWFATPENEWQQLFHRFLPRWLTVSNKNVLQDFYQGKSSLYRSENLKTWLEPVLWWSAFIVVLGIVMICLNVIVRRQWTRNERLSYPIIQLPMAITEDGGTREFFRNKNLWIGFAGAAALNIINGLHHFFPALPYIPVSYLDHDLGKYFTSKPWNAIGSLRLPLYPFAIGLGFFLPLDLSFSIWFFYLFRKAQQVMGVAMGMRALPGFPYINQQSSGAWIGIFFVALWLSKSHLKTVAKCVFKTGDTDAEEPMRYRSAVIGIIIGMVLITMFCYRAGMSISIIIPFFVIFFMLSTAITRMRAELGPPTHELVRMNSGNMLVDILGTRRIGPNNLSIFPLFWFFSGRGYRSHLMPHQLESFKMAEEARVNGKRLIYAMIIAMILGSLSAFWALLHMSFDWGLDLIPIGHDSGVFWQLQNRLNNPTGTDVPAVSFMGVGFIFTFLLMFLRMRFLWWPLHPAGYALSMNFGIDYIWSCLIFSSLIKWLVLKYGGMNLHRKTTKFFFGIILGEYCVGGFWSLVSVLIKQRAYDFYHA
ncbi:hypothetical protein GF312_09985 [Candidatus Poribacteria bacterium]|nr:hypothetical protein [Candidatus Poribacteria bacterium]